MPAKIPREHGPREFPEAGRMLAERLDLRANELTGLRLDTHLEGRKFGQLPPRADFIPPVILDSLLNSFVKNTSVEWNYSVVQHPVLLGGHLFRA